MLSIIIEILLVVCVLLLIVFKDIIFFRLYKSGEFFNATYPESSACAIYATLIGLPIVKIAMKHFLSNLGSWMMVLIIILISIGIVIIFIFNYKGKYKLILLKYNSTSKRYYRIVDILIIIYLLFVFITFRI
jgi:hypothetical protein